MFRPNGQKSIRFGTFFFRSSNYKRSQSKGSALFSTFSPEKISHRKNISIDNVELYHYAFITRKSFWGGAFGGSNPITELISTTKSKNTSDISNASIDFSAIRANHLSRAVSEVQAKYDKNWEELTLKLGDLSPEDLLDSLHELETEGCVLKNMAALYYHTHCFEDSWINAAKQVPNSWTHEESKEVLSALDIALSKVNGGSKTKIHHSLQERIDSYKRRGIHFDKKIRETLSTLKNARLELETIFVSSDEVKKDDLGSSTKEQLQALYTITSIRQKEAEIFGFESYVDFALDNRIITNSKDIKAIHDDIARHASTALSRNNNNDPVPTEKLDLKPYLSADGILQGLFAITRALFGLIISEDEKPSGWHPDVRLFHVMTEDKKRVGSFYIDIFKRSTKTRANLMHPLTPSLSFINTNINPPTWDDMPTPVCLDDVTSMFHEFGHVLQFLLCDEDLRRGSFNDSSKLDVSEVLPHFMEHWVFEKSILQTLAHLSGTSIPDDVVEAVQEQRRRDKVEESLRRVFLGQLELEMFSRNKQQPEESLVTLQRRMGETYVPHELLPKSDLSPMVEIMESNGIRQKPVAQYRYLLSEIVSAAIFTKFINEGIADQEKVRELGISLRDMMFKSGNQVNVHEVLQQFCGERSISTKAFLELYCMD